MTECMVGVVDCALGKAVNSSTPCALYDAPYLLPNDPNALWVSILGGLAMCAMAFFMGANDVANAWGTAVGSGAVALRPATIIAGISDFLGAITLGSGVSNTIGKGVSTVTNENCFACGYCNSLMTVYVASMLGALIGAGAFLGAATFTAMPVSATHAIVGGVAGATVAAVGGGCLNWSFQGGLGAICASWIISPILAGILGAVFYASSRSLVVHAAEPVSGVLFWLPFLYASVTFVMVVLIMKKSSLTKNLGDEVHYGTAGGCMLGMFGFAFLVVVPFVRASLTSAMSDIELAEQESKPGLSEHSVQNVLLRGVDYSKITGSDAGESQRSRLESEHVGVTHSDEDEGLSDVDLSPNPALGMEEAANKSDGTARENEEGKIDGQMGKRQAEESSILKNHRSFKLVLSTQSNEAVNELRDETCQEEIEVQETFSGVNSELQLKHPPVTENMSGAQRDALACFKHLLVFVAALESFAHGANDTPNATGAFAAIYQTQSRGLNSSCQSRSTPLWIMTLAGLFVLAGIMFVGHRVIDTIGRRFAALDYHSAFCIEFASTVTVMIATLFELPVSTTHCQIGAVTFVGVVAIGHKKGPWNLLGKIALSWIITLPFAGLIAAAVMALTRAGLRQTH
jgi:sodium-dependent phosphate transporter